MADLREDAARAVVQEAQQAAEPRPTLADLVTRLRDPHTLDRFGVLADVAAEIDRRLTALEVSKWEIRREAIEGAARFLRTNEDDASAADDIEQWERERRETLRRPALVGGCDRPCALFTEYPGSEGCARCGFAEPAHG